MNRGISIIVPVYKDLQGLEETFQLLSSTDLPAQVEWIICNDGADPEISNWVASRHLREVGIAENKGSYNARNAGIEIAKYEWLVFADAGIEVKNGWFQAAENQSDTYDYFAFNIKIAPESQTSLSKRYSSFVEFQTDKFWHKKHFGPTAFLVVKKKVFDNLGTFDQQLYSGGDFEFGNRCWTSKVAMTYVAQVFVFHAARSLKGKFKKHLRVFPGIRNLQKSYPERSFDLPNIDFKELVISPIKWLYELKNMKKSEAYKSGQFTRIQLIWLISVHKILHSLAIAHSLVLPNKFAK